MTLRIPNLDRDPSGQTYLEQKALTDLGFYTGKIDNWRGPKTNQALLDYQKVISSNTSAIVSRGTGQFDWLLLEIVGEDIYIRDAKVTCFGGSRDPQDSGATASGVSTKDNPTIIGCALPIQYTGKNAPTRLALQGTPIPKIPWKYPVEFIRNMDGRTLSANLIDLGPAGYTKHAGDLTIAAARHFNPRATATNFSETLDIRIPGAVKFLA